MAGRLFTSESVTEGHPDKIADQISDSVLDELLRQDPNSRVAVECLVTTGLVVVAGEVTTESYVEIPRVVRERIIAIGYDSSTKGFDGGSCGVEIAIGQQSPDIAQGVDVAFESRTGESTDLLDLQGAGDQGLMFGYACSETPSLMPLPIDVAHRLAEQLATVRKDGTMPYLRPDGKTQVTVEYDGDRPIRIDTVVLSSQHAADIDLDALLAPDVRKHVVDPVLERYDIDISDYRLLVNPTGRFEIGGPMGTPVSPAARSSSTATAAWRVTAAERSPVRTRRRSTDRAPTRCVGWPRTWWRRGSPAAARCRWRTRSARLIRWASTWRPLALNSYRWSRFSRPCWMCLIYAQRRLSATSI